jgi:hypothetical protein
MRSREAPVAAPSFGVLPEKETRVVVLFVNLIVVELSFATTLPFASTIDAVIVDEFWPVAIDVGLAEQLIDAAAPNTVIPAEAELPPALATTLHGCVGEFVAVAANKPLLVTAPQPPVTVHVVVEPAGAPVTVNCC